LRPHVPTWFDELQIMKKALAVVALTSCVAAACRAASPTPLPENLLACAKLQDPGVRVRCYDAQIAAINPPVATPSSPAAAMPAAAMPAAAASAAPPKAVASAPPRAPAAEQPPAAQFGNEQLPRTSPAAAAHQDEALLASITAMRTVGQKTLISLSNGQVWRQEGSQLTGLSRVGDGVRIERGALGSYHMSIVAYGAKNWVLVTRVM
jgi:hypothetical protein